jgi:hypothetical protein
MDTNGKVEVNTRVNSDDQRMRLGYRMNFKLERLGDWIWQRQRLHQLMLFTKLYYYDNEVYDVALQTDDEGND